MAERDLEQEFADLILVARHEITLKKERGELTGDEAYTLNDMLDERMKPRRSSWNHSGCTMDEESLPEDEVCPIHDDHKDRCGWSSSMGYHC